MGPLLAHLLVFSWPGDLVFDVFLIFFWVAVSFCFFINAGVGGFSVGGFVFLISLVFGFGLIFCLFFFFFYFLQGHLFLGPPLSPPLGDFGWASLPHGILLLSWRDLALLAPLFFVGPFRALLGPFPLILFGVFWAALLGALWALASTTPPFLWANDGIELVTTGAILSLVFWAHCWPSMGCDPCFLVLAFPCFLLVLQGLGSWTFHHETILYLDIFLVFAAEHLSFSFWDPGLLFFLGSGAFLGFLWGFGFGVQVSFYLSCLSDYFAPQRGVLGVAFSAQALPPTFYPVFLFSFFFMAPHFWSFFVVVGGGLALFFSW